jgi:hypothetical protein
MRALAPALAVVTLVACTPRHTVEVTDAGYVPVLAMPLTAETELALDHSVRTRIDLGHACDEQGMVVQRESWRGRLAVERLVDSPADSRKAVACDAEVVGWIRAMAVRTPWGDTVAATLGDDGVARFPIDWVAARDIDRGWTLEVPGAHAAARWRLSRADRELARDWMQQAPPRPLLEPLVAIISPAAPTRVIVRNRGGAPAQPTRDDDGNDQYDLDLDVDGFHVRFAGETIAPGDDGQLLYGRLDNGLSYPVPNLALPALGVFSQYGRPPLDVIVVGLHSAKDDAACKAELAGLARRGDIGVVAMNRAVEMLCPYR